MTGNDEPAADIDIQSKEDIAYRALVLGAFIMRGVLEQFYRRSDDLADQWANETGINELVAWMKKERLSGYQSDREKELFAKGLGLWGMNTLIASSWRVEGLGTLLWSISQVDDLPPYDTIFESEDILERIPLYKSTRSFFGSSRLHRVEELLAARDCAELWHWRSRTAGIQKVGGDPPDGMTFPELIQGVTEEAHREGRIPTPIDGDFPAFGKAYSNLTEEEYTRATSIAVERHFALNWVCGYSGSWDKTPTDT